MNIEYNVAFYKSSVYDYAVQLIQQTGSSSGVHLDIGCGYGAIAEPLRALGLIYVGLDRESDSIDAVRSRGFEAHSVDILDPELFEQQLLNALAGRQLASVSLLDTLEHLPFDNTVLTVLRKFVSGRSVPLIISVPNATHRDVAYKLLTGSWDYTNSGLLDKTHLVHHTEKLLTDKCIQAGWRQIAAMDVKLEISDQYFPIDHVALSPNSLLGSYLRIRSASCDVNSTVNQFVRAYLPAPIKSEWPILRNVESAERPFLSIITRSQGRRPGTLRDVLLCLAAQTCQDFELIIIGHKVSPEQRYLLERLIEDQPEYMRDKTRLLLLDRGGRTAPLNLGFAEARGQYAAILDDDDIVMSHWVETFHTMAEQGGLGECLRSATVEQDIEAIIWPNGVSGFHPVSALKRTYPGVFDFYAHLSQNYTPPLCWAIPTSVYHHMGLRFDENLDTAEDWDFEMQALFLCGYRAVPTITSIYHKWVKGENSFTVHNHEVWARDNQRILAKMDAEPRLFPAGASRVFREQQAKIALLEKEVASLRIIVDGRVTTSLIQAVMIFSRRGYNLAKRIARKLGIRRIR